MNIYRKVNQSTSTRDTTYDSLSFHSFHKIDYSILYRLLKNKVKMINSLFIFRPLIQGFDNGTIRGCLFFFYFRMKISIR